MGTIHKLLERFGFVRLRDFGLLLTAERRVLTMRTTILDDGFGECVVGWVDGDLATMELATWGTARPTPKPALPKPVPTPPKPVATKPTPALKPPPIPPTRASVQPIVEVASPPVEEAWEWEIAVARARADAVPATRVPARPDPIVAPPPDEPEELEEEWDWEIAVARARAETNLAPRLAPSISPPASLPGPAAPVVSPRKSGPHATQWAAKEPPSPWNADTAICPMERYARITEEQLAAAESRPRTIIPIPSLPAAVDARLVRPLDHYTRTLPAPRRFPRSTNQRIAAAPANDDHTSPTVVSLSARARQPAR
jgi:hypothetical protein